MSTLSKCPYNTKVIFILDNGVTIKGKRLKQEVLKIVKVGDDFESVKSVVDVYVSIKDDKIDPNTIVDWKPIVKGEDK